MSDHFSLLLSILFFVAVAATTVAYAVLKKRAKLTDPILQFVFFLSLFVLPLSIRAYMELDIEGDVTNHLFMLLPYFPEALILTAVGLLFFVAAYYSRFAGTIASKLPQVHSGTHWGRAFAVLALCSLFLIEQLASSDGGLLSFILLGYHATAETVGKGYLAMGFPWLFVASMFLLYGYAVERKVRYLLSFAMVFGVVVLMHLVMARRAQLLYMGLTVWMFWHGAVRPIRMRTVVAAGILCFVALNLMGGLRGATYESVGDFWASTVEGFQQRQSYGFGNGFIYTLTTGEFVVPFETFPQMIESVGTTVNPEFGMTYLRAPLQVIPQALFSGRPLPLANWYMSRFYGGGYDFNEGRAFFFLAEGYLNFGIVGVILTMLFWGFFLGTLHRYRLSSGNKPGSLLLYSLIVAFVYAGIAGESISLLVGLPETSLVAAIIGLLITSRKSKGSKALSFAPRPA